MKARDMPYENIYVGIDIETTGLKPAEGAILEIATIVISPELGELGAYAIVVAPAKPLPAMHPRVREMHEANGLLAEIAAGRGVPLELAIARVRRFWARYGVVPSAPAGQKPPLFGASVQFDRAWLDHHCPALTACLHYRNADISGMREMLRRMRPDWSWAPPTLGGRASAHRALPDIRASLRLAREIGTKVGGRLAVEVPWAG